jgi:hypothetical protein
MSSNPVTYEPTGEDLLHLLVNGHKRPGDPLKLEGIRAVLLEVHEKQNDICSAIVRHYENPQTNAQALASVASFKSILPPKPSAIKSSNLDPCSRMLIGIHGIFQSALLQKKDGSSSIPPCFKSVLAMIDDAKGRIFTEKIQLKEKAILNSDDHRKRPYLKDATRPPEGFEHCILCGHDFVDYPDTNEGVMDRNNAKRLKYDQEVTAQKTASSDKVSSFRIPHFLLHYLILTDPFDIFFL